MTNASLPCGTASLYRPLDLATQELRLLEIYPSEDDSASIQVRLFERAFEDVRGNFIPFSYVWGDPEDTETITINGIAKDITKNLAQLLRQTRNILPSILAKASWKGPAFFWADAICINQEDIEERNHQVQLLQSIYGSSPVVLAWLGQGKAKDSHLAATFAKAFHTWWDTWEFTRNSDSEVLDPNCECWMQRNPQFWTFSGLDGRTNPYWEALEHMIDSNYWSRAWTFQEITLPADAILMYGSSLLDMACLKAIYRWTRAFLAQPESNFPFVEKRSRNGLLLEARRCKIILNERFIEPMDTRQKLARQDRPNLKLVSNLRRLEASDPRDKVYGLLGLMETSLTADYKKDVRQVYSEFVSAWIEEIKDLNFLLDAGRAYYSGRPEEQFDLPSWVPNWVAICHKLRHRKDVLPLPGRIFRLRFQPSARFPRRQPQISSSLRSLTATGMVCGRVEEVDLPWTGDPKTAAFATSFLHFATKCTSHLKSLPPTTERMHIFQTLFRTGLLDFTPESFKTRLFTTGTKRTFHLALCFLIAMLQGLHPESSPTSWRSITETYFPILGITPGRDFSRSWREDIFGNLEAEASTAHWQDAAAALEWTWENCRNEILLVRNLATGYLARKLKFMTKNGGVQCAADIEGEGAAL
ncbi:hypothetical protein ACJZ2D_002914 [Fusarium nematophilum]